MAIAGATTPPRFEIGRVINRAFGVIGENFITFIILSAFLTIPILLVSYANILTQLSGIHYTPAFAGPGTVAAIVGGAIIGALVYFLFNNLLQAALTHGTIVTLNGGHASFGECFATGLRNAIPLAIITFVATLGIAAGFILLIVPGAILAIAWSVMTPVRVAEHTGTLQTLGRSFDLTRGFRWHIFGLDVIVALVFGMLEGVIRPLAGVSFVATAGDNIPVTYMVLLGAVRIVSGMFGATLAASIYYELRLVKEGIGPEQIAAIFA